MRSTKQTTKLHALGSMLPVSEPSQQKCKNGIKIYNKPCVCFYEVTATSTAQESKLADTISYLCYLMTLSIAKII
jgi:hypothetical protein